MIKRKAYIKRSSKPIKRSAPIKKGKPVKRPKGYDDPDYLEWLRKIPCIVCLHFILREFRLPVSRDAVISYQSGRFLGISLMTGCCQDSEAAHVGLRGIRQKCKDREAIPLGAYHHRHVTCPGGGPESHHTLGKKFWAFHGIDRKEVIEMLNRMYHEETGK